MSNPYIEEAEDAILHTYNRYQIVLDKGEGVHLYDVNGKEYLDFAAGIAVQSLGYNNKEYTQALKDQIDKLTHISNLYYSVPMAEAAEKVKKASGMEKVFFTNSGTEAIEGALKVARKYSYAKYGENRYEIIAMNHSFHGRSMGALSVTGNEKYRKPFEPLIGGVRFADYNDLESVKSQVNEKTCAIILETVQGEGGIYPATEEFLKGVKALCEEKDLILILDDRVGQQIVHAQNRIHVRMAGVRCGAGCHDLCKGTGMRCSGRRICPWQKSGRRFPCTGRPWNHLRRKSLCLRGSQQSI